MNGNGEKVDGETQDTGNNVEAKEDKDTEVSASPADATPTKPEETNYYDLERGEGWFFAT